MIQQKSAEACWLALTRPFHGRRPGDRYVSFRRYGPILVALFFTPEIMFLQRAESLTPGSGRFRALLSDLREVADHTGLRLRGNAWAYATMEVRSPDQDRLTASYARAGIAVGPEPWHALEYVPPRLQERPRLTSDLWEAGRP